MIVTGVVIGTNNGDLPTSSLTVIDAHGHKLRNDAAKSFGLMRQDGMPPGNVTSAYRTRQEQADALAQLGPNIAQPPGESTHGEAVAVDFPEPLRSWARAYGRPYGWRFPVSSEPWHGVFYPQYQTKFTPNVPPVITEPVHDTPPEDDDMKLYRIIEDGRIFLGGPGTWSQVPNMDTVAVLVTRYGQWEDIHIVQGQGLDDVFTP